MREWSELLGKPYRLGAADPSEGFDCWTLVDYARRECFGLVTPIAPSNTMQAVRSYDVAATTIEQTRRLSCWHLVKRPGAVGDVVAMSLDSTRPLHHVGLSVERGILHAWGGFSVHGIGSVMLTPWDRIDRIFKRVEVYACRA